MNGARSITTTFSYDSLNRVTDKSYDGDPQMKAVKFCYDGKAYAEGDCAGGAVEGLIGRLTAVGTSESSTAYTSYDGLGRALASKQTTGTAYPAMSYTYAPAGLRTIGLPSGKVLTYDFDAVGRVTGVSGLANKWYAGTPAVPIAYAPHGQSDHLLLGNGVVETRHFNGKLQPVSIQASALLTLGYDFGEGSNNGNIQSQTIAAPKSAGGMLTLRQDYAYDALNRLESTKESVAGEIGERWRLWHQHDQFGNQWVDVGAGKTNIPLNFATPTGQAQYNPVNNRLLKNAAGVDLPANAYDVAGNLLNHPYMSGPAVYDAENRLTSVGTTATFTYDGEGRRVKKTVGGGATTVYVYDASGQVAAEYITGGAQPASGTQYVTADHLGSTRLVTDQNGAVVSRKDYFPFGEEIPANETHGSRHLVAGYGAPSGVKDLFTGKERDGETGLDYFGARYFSETQGRFTSPDPLYFQAAMLTDPQRFNLYAYVRNNPLRYVDPKGEEIELLGSDEERKKLLAAIKDAVGTGAAKYLSEKKVTSWFGLGKTRYVVGVSDQTAFARTNSVAGELSPMINDSRTITLGMVGSGATVSLDSGQQVRLTPVTADALGRPLGTTGVTGIIGGEVASRIMDPAQPQGSLPGILMSNGVSSPLDGGISAAHELGHAWAILTGDFRTVGSGAFANPYNTDHAGVRLENKVRENRKPGGSQRMFHNVP